MERILECSCGHGAGEHHEYGCGVRAGNRRCPCALSALAVVDSAVEHVRTDYERRWGTVAEDAS